LPIAIVSFDRVFFQESGINVQCLLGWVISVACISMYFGNSFDTAKLLLPLSGFLCIDKGVGLFLIGTVTENQKNTTV
jgi:hypothetical protein